MIAFGLIASARASHDEQSLGISVTALLQRLDRPISAWSPVATTKSLLSTPAVNASIARSSSLVFWYASPSSGQNLNWLHFKFACSWKISTHESYHLKTPKAMAILAISTARGSSQPHREYISRNCVTHIVDLFNFGQVSFPLLKQHFQMKAKQYSNMRGIVLIVIQSNSCRYLSNILR